MTVLLAILVWVAFDIQKSYQKAAQVSLLCLLNEHTHSIITEKLAAMFFLLL